MLLTAKIVIELENSVTEEELEKKYENGCERCCCAGIHQKCDRCPVEPCYERMKNVLKNIDKLKKDINW